MNGIITKDTALNAIIMKYLSSIDVKEITRGYYRKDITYFFEWVKSSRTALSENILIEYKRALQAKGFSSLTINAYLTGIKKFMGYLFQNGIIKVNPGQNLKMLTIPSGYLREPFTVEQVRMILNAIDRKSIEGKRDFALVNLLARCGLRTIEIIGSNIDDIKTKTGKQVLYVHGKKRDDKDDFVVLTKEAYQSLKEYLSAREPYNIDAPLFISHSNKNIGGKLSTRGIRNILEKYIRITGLTSIGLSCHCFRHFAATSSLMNGCDVVKVQKMLRHKDLSSTMRYVHVLDRLENAAETFVKI
ncbi:MAG: tyrosine-type recombinase/integrase [Spirochaetes bacterium]|nr:tyrosine-type recombinase/integrase [Spirochaetota bacterium]